MLFDSYCVRLRTVPCAPFVYIQAALYLGKGWEIQIFATRTISGLPESPERLEKWLADNKIQTQRSKLMNNMIAYGPVLPWEGQPETVAKQFCELIGKVDGARKQTGPEAPEPQTWSSDLEAKRAALLKRLK